MIGVHYSRRDVLKLASAIALGITACGDTSSMSELESALAELERQSGGRLGVSIASLEAGQIAGHRADERFGMCSTFKLLLVAVILLEMQERRLDPNERVHYTAEDIVFHAPVTELYLERGFMSVLELAEAAQITSDNVAANLLLDLVNGPLGFTQKLREMGDPFTRLDRYEPDMNIVPLGEVRDTTTPSAMAATLRRLLTGTQLTEQSKVLLRTWMENTRTGLNRLRGGFPSSWRSGDKTGTAMASGMPNKYNDVAVAWPDDGNPGFVVAAYYEADGEYDRIRARDVAVLKEVGELAATAWTLGHDG